jgi:L-asparaginase
MPDMLRPVISVGALGGTIAMRPTGAGRQVSPELDADELVAALPGLAKVAQVRAHTVCNVGSPSVTFDHVLDALWWADSEVVAGARGVVLTHGTDTMEETAYLLDLLWRRPEPLILTGAMRSFDEPGADGPANLLASVVAATCERLRGLGTLVVMDDAIHLGDRVAKTHATSVSTFASPWGAPIGRVEEGVVRLDYLPAHQRPEPLDVPASRTSRVALIEASLGCDGQLVRLAVEGGYDGVVIAGVGAGHVSAAAAQVLGDAVTRLPVVVATRTGAGRTATVTYGYPGAEVDLLRRGVVMAGALSARKARLLLWVLLGGAADRARIAREFAVRGRSMD